MMDATHTAAGYRATRNGDSLTIHNVPIFCSCERGDMQFDDAWIAAAVAKAKLAEREGYMPPLHIRHHESNNDNCRAAGYFQVLGTKSITFKGSRRTAVMANLVITCPETQAEVLATRLPYRSVEIFNVDKPSIDGLALLDHEAPFLELPMLMVSEVEGAETFQHSWKMDASEDGSPAVACFRRGESAHLLFRADAMIRPPSEARSAKMADDTDADTLRELMASYDEYLAKWEKLHGKGRQDEFDKWFTEQVVGKKGGKMKRTRKARSAKMNKEKGYLHVYQQRDGTWTVAHTMVPNAQVKSAAHGRQLDVGGQIIKEGIEYESQAMRIAKNLAGKGPVKKWMAHTRTLRNVDLAKTAKMGEAEQRRVEVERQRGLDEIRELTKKLLWLDRDPDNLDTEEIERVEEELHRLRQRWDMKRTRPQKIAAMRKWCEVRMGKAVSMKSYTAKDRHGNVHPVVVVYDKDDLKYVASIRRGRPYKTAAGTTVKPIAHTASGQTPEEAVANVTQDLLTEGVQAWSRSAKMGESSDLSSYTAKHKATGNVYPVDLRRMGDHYVATIWYGSRAIQEPGSTPEEAVAAATKALQSVKLKAAPAKANFMSDPSVISALRKIVREHQYADVTDATGGTTPVDVQTANAILTVYDALKDENKRSMAGMSISRMAKTAWKLVRSGKMKRPLMSVSKYMKMSSQEDYFKYLDEAFARLKHLGPAKAWNAIMRELMSFYNISGEEAKDTMLAWAAANKSKKGGKMKSARMAMNEPPAYAYGWGKRMSADSKKPGSEVYGFSFYDAWEYFLDLVSPPSKGLSSTHTEFEAGWRAGGGQMKRTRTQKITAMRKWCKVRMK